MNPDELRELLGWCTVVNFGIMLLSTVAILAAGKRIARLHGKMFGMPEADLTRLYLQYLSGYKALTLAFNFAPWLALTLMRK
jgi:hypothetical protein